MGTVTTAGLMMGLTEDPVTSSGPDIQPAKATGIAATTGIRIEGAYHQRCGAYDTRSARRPAPVAVSRAFPSRLPNGYCIASRTR